MRPVSRQLQLLNNRVFRRVSREDLSAAFAQLGLARGTTVFARISMRRLGYVTGGAAEVVGAILDVIGPEGTLATSAWPAPADAAGAAPLFDVKQTPSECGLFAEAVRAAEGACRSLSPVASLAAVGAEAREITAGHERAATPFGADGPYGRLMERSPRLLLVGVHLGGLLRHVQDRVGYPNLYETDPRPFEVVDDEGTRRSILSRALRQDLPPVVIMPGNRPENRDFLLLPDYALMFPAEREEAVMEAGYLRYNRSRFLGRRERMAGRGILKEGRVGAAPAALLDGGRMIDQVARDLAWDLERLKEEYDPESLRMLGLPAL